LLNEAGLSYQKPRRTAAEADEDDQEELREQLKKAAGDGRHGSLHRSNQKPVQVEPRVMWFPRGMRLAVELSGQRDWTCLLGVIIQDGNCFFFDSKSTSPPST